MEDGVEIKVAVFAQINKPLQEPFCPRRRYVKTRVWLRAYYGTQEEMARHEEIWKDICDGMLGLISRLKSKRGFNPVWNYRIACKHDDKHSLHFGFSFFSTKRYAGEHMRVLDSFLGTLFTRGVHCKKTGTFDEKILVKFIRVPEPAGVRCSHYPCRGNVAELKCSAWGQYLLQTEYSWALEQQTEISQSKLLTSGQGTLFREHSNN